ncbi:MAG: MGMT family protein [Gemmatimonadota bacterium]
MSEFSDRVYALVRRIPSGRVINYGGVAAMLGSPRAARGVGYALSALPEGTDVPWWRVVNRDGEISIRHDPFARRIQRALLEDEGVAFDDEGRIDMRRFAWHPDADDRTRIDDDDSGGGDGGRGPAPGDGALRAGSGRTGGAPFPPGDGRQEGTS